MRRSAALILALLAWSAHGAELADLVRQAVATGVPASGTITGKSAAKIVEITKARGELSATAEVLAPLPAGMEICRRVRIAFYLTDVETKDGTLVPYTQTLDMPWCPSAAGYAALRGTPGLFRVGK